jgi:hypothetical protein
MALYLFQDDLRFAHLSLEFASLCSRRYRARAAWAKLARAAAEVLALLEEKHCASAEQELDNPELCEILSANSWRIEIAMHSYWRAWSALAREVAARKGKLPPMLLEECGNAYEVANKLREAAQFIAVAVKHRQTPAHAV